MLPSVVHALVQILGVATVVLWGREGLDDEDGRASIVKFDDRTFVPYGVSLISSNFLAIKLQHGLIRRPMQ